MMIMIMAAVMIMNTLFEWFYDSKLMLMMVVVTMKVIMRKSMK